MVEQTLERVRREMEADEREYEERLAKARKREEMMRRAAKGRAVKRQVSRLSVAARLAPNVDLQLCVKETRSRPAGGR